MVNIEKIWEQLRDMKNALDRTVILWGEDDVLTRAVENLLATRSEWQVIRIKDDLDEFSLAQMMEEVTPEVLIVHEGVFNGNVHQLIKFVQDYSRLRIITIGLENNKMDIYSKKSICIEKSSDLLAVIQNGSVAEI